MKLALLSLVFISSLCLADDGDYMLNKISSEFDKWPAIIEKIEREVANGDYANRSTIILLFKSLSTSQKTIAAIHTKDRFLWDNKYARLDEDKIQELTTRLEAIRVNVFRSWVSTDPGAENFWSFVEELAEIRGLPVFSRSNPILKIAIELGYVNNLEEQMRLIDVMRLASLQITNGALNFQDEIKTFDQLAALYKVANFTTRALLLEKALKEKLVHTLPRLRWLVSGYYNSMNSSYEYLVDSVVFRGYSKEENIEYGTKWIQWLGNRYMRDIRQMARQFEEPSTKVLEEYFKLNWQIRLMPDLFVKDRPASFPTLNDLRTYRSSQCLQLFVL